MIQSLLTRSMSFCKVLSIQSHVVSGYVGNKAAVFPLQVLGYEVDFINSVQFASHTGYPTMKGSVLSGKEVADLAIGLKENGLINYDYVVTGYIGSETFLNGVLEVLDLVKTENEQARYVCDPVLGDNGKYYVPEALVDIFKHKLIPRAYMITPNQFEAELLTGMKIITESDVLTAMKVLHKLGPEIVVLTSSELKIEENLIGESKNPGSNDLEKLICYIGFPSDENKKDLMVAKIVVDKQPGSYTGTGDAMCALLLAWIHRLSSTQLSPDSTCLSAEQELVQRQHPVCQGFLQAIATVQSMVKRSSICQQAELERQKQTESYKKSEIELKKDKCSLIRSRELQVIPSKLDIENPPIGDLNLDSLKCWKLT